MTECSCDKRSSVGWSLRGSRSKRVTCGGSGGGGSSGAALITQLTPRLTRASSRTAGAAHSSKLGVTRDTLNLLGRDVLVRVVDNSHIVQTTTTSSPSYYTLTDYRIMRVKHNVNSKVSADCHFHYVIRYVINSSIIDSCPSITYIQLDRLGF